jgi:hypothetical protein
LVPTLNSQPRRERGHLAFVVEGSVEEVMERREQSVRVWVGLDLLQAQMLKQVLLDNGIECSADRDMGVIPAGEFGEIGLWVSKDNEARAQTLLQQTEDEMSEQLDRSLPDDEEQE